MAIAIHIIGGSVAIVAGYTALWATKGAPLHRRAGMAFVCSMLVMTLTAAVLAAILGQWGNLTGATLAMLFLFGSIALLAGASDIRILRGADLRGAARLRRHLWRVCFALFIATGSFFLGQADEIPKAIRFMPLLVVLALFPLVSIPYWLRRVRTRRSRPNAVLRASPDTA